MTDRPDFRTLQAIYPTGGFLMGRCLPIRRWDPAER